MTSFVAWVGVEQRGPTTLYFASDSRISWLGEPDTWDCGRKLFASRTEPEIFGFVGYVLLPQSVLHRCCDLIDQGLRPKECENSAELKSQWLFSRVESELSLHPNNRSISQFSIFYGIRMGIGKPGATYFHMFEISWSPTKKLSMKKIEIPTEISSIIYIDGSGKSSVEEWSARWGKSDQGNTSRTFFSSFCDSLNSKKDQFSGGEPQLVGIYRTKPAQIFGVVTERGPSFQGMLNPGIRDDANIEWRDSLFQRVNSSGKLIKNAQRHARPKQLQGIPNPSEK